LAQTNEQFLYVLLAMEEVAALQEVVVAVEAAVI
jgi:hypothetical protein